MNIWIRGLSIAGLVVLLIAFSIAETAFAQMGCLVKLRNGREMKSAHCYEEGDQVFIQRFGGYVAVKKPEVEEIGSADIPNATPAPAAVKGAPAGSIREKSRPSPAKQEKPEPTEKEKLSKEIASFEMQLKENRNSQKIYCGQAAEATAKSLSGPNIPAANQSIVSERTAQAFQNQIQHKVEAHRKNESCDYYNNMIPRLESKLEELKQKRDLLW